MFKGSLPVLSFVLLITSSGVGFANEALCVQAEDPAELIRACDAVIRKNSRAAWALGNRATGYMRKGDNDSALIDLNKAIALEQDANFYANRAIILTDRKNYADALRDAERSVKLNKKLHLGWYLRGFIKLEQGQLQSALADLDKAVSLDPKNPQILRDRGRNYEMLGKTAEAVADYSGAETLAGSEDKELVAFVRQRRERLTRWGDVSLHKLDVDLDADVRDGNQYNQKKLSDGTKRVALIVGNAKYQHAPELPSAASDAAALAAKFRDLGFTTVLEKRDLNLNDLSAALKEFGDTSNSADWAVIYYAGHGIEVAGLNYLLPVDAKLEDVSHVEDEAVALSRVLSKVENARKMRLVLLDACRENPFIPKMKVATGATRSIGRGLSRIDAPSGVLVAYASREGQVSANPNGKHGPFAEALLKHLDEPGVEIGLLLRKVRDRVMEQTTRKQEPFTYGSLPAEQLFINQPD